MLQRTLPFSHLLLSVMCFMAALAVTAPAQAQDEDTEITAEDLYVNLEPEFVLNYGQGSRLHFARVQVTLVAADATALPEVTHHTPALRHIVVMTISAASRETVTTGAGRRELRNVLLQEMQAYLEAETGNPVVSDVLFRNFIVQ